MKLSLQTGTVSNLSVESRLVAAEQFMRTAAENARGHAVDAAASAVFGASALPDSAGMPIKWVAVELNGQKYAGMLAECPFQSGDTLHLVVDEALQLFALARPSDRLIALRPQCVRGGRAYWIRARRRCGVVLALMCLTVLLAVFSADLPTLWGLGLLLGFGLLWAVIEYRYFIENVRMSTTLTESILSALGLPNSSDIDLNLIAKSQRQATELPGYGWNFYRY